MTPADIIQKYIAIRDKVASITEAHEAALKPYADALVTLEGLMMNHLAENGLDNVKSEFGTAFKKTGTRVRVADRAAFDAFVVEQDSLSWFTNAVSKEKIVEYVKENNCAPPGVDVTYITDVQFNRPRS